MYVCMHACMHACMYVCMYACMHAYTHTYAFIHVDLTYHEQLAPVACAHRSMRECIIARMCMHARTRIEDAAYARVQNRRSAPTARACSGDGLASMCVRCVARVYSTWMLLRSGVTDQACGIALIAPPPRPERLAAARPQMGGGGRRRRRGRPAHRPLPPAPHAPPARRLSAYARRLSACMPVRTLGRVRACACVGARAPPRALRSKSATATVARCAQCSTARASQQPGGATRRAGRAIRAAAGAGTGRGRACLSPPPSPSSPLLRLLLEARDERARASGDHHAQDAARGGAGAGMRGAAGGGVRTGSADARRPGGACRRVAAASACMRGRAGRGPCGGPRAAAAGALGGVCGRREQRRAHAFARERRVLQ